MVWALTVLQATDCSTYISTVESSSVQIPHGHKHVCVFNLKTYFSPFATAPIGLYRWFIIRVLWGKLHYDKEGKDGTAAFLTSRDEPTSAGVLQTTDR